MENSILYIFFLENTDNPQTISSVDKWYTISTGYFVPFVQKLDLTIRWFSNYSENSCEITSNHVILTDPNNAQCFDTFRLPPFYRNTIVNKLIKIS